MVAWRENGRHSRCVTASDAQGHGVSHLGVRVLSFTHKLQLRETPTARCASPGHKADAHGQVRERSDAQRGTAHTSALAGDAAGRWLPLHDRRRRQIADPPLVLICPT